MPTTRSRSLTRRLVSIVLTIAIVVPLLAVAGLAIATRTGHIGMALITTGSMTGYANPGDLVVTVPTPSEQVRKGDVLTRRLSVPGEHVQYITHRVTEVSQADGAVTVRTKGDVKSVEDVEATRLGGTAMIVHTVVPKVGRPLWWATHNLPLLAIAYVVLAGAYLLVGGLYDSAKANRRHRREPAGAPESVNA